MRRPPARTARSAAGNTRSPGIFRSSSPRAHPRRRGGGARGAVLAFQLSLRGLRPVVLERRFVGAGATGRSSGLVRMHYDLEPESALAWSSYQIFRNWSEIVGGECGFTRTGFLQFVAPDHAPQLRANIAMHQRLGIPSLVVTGDDGRRLAPSVYTAEFD